MGAFEFENTVDINARNCNCSCGSNGCDRGEVCIIAQKVFDQ